MIAIKTVSAPVLAAGAIAVTFGQYEKVLKAEVGFDDPFDDSTVYGHERAISDNIVTVTVRKAVSTGAGVWGNWAVANDSDIAGGTLTVVVEGE